VRRSRLAVPFAAPARVASAVPLARCRPRPRPTDLRHADAVPLQDRRMGPFKHAEPIRPRSAIVEVRWAPRPDKRANAGRILQTQELGHRPVKPQSKNFNRRPRWRSTRPGGVQRRDDVPRPSVLSRANLEENSFTPGFREAVRTVLAAAYEENRLVLRLHLEDDRVPWQGVPSLTPVSQG